jgi:hypothetical protein
MKFLRYVWALPYTLLGLLFIPFTFFTMGGMQVVGGVLELHGQFISFVLKHCFPVRGGAAALTLGHVILGLDRETLNASRRHERVHVRQYEILGPFFIFVYLGASLWALVGGEGAYRGNYLEKKAVELENNLQRDKGIKRGMDVGKKLKN